MRSFTVIQGGRSESEAAASMPNAAAVQAYDRLTTNWRVDLHRAGTVDGGAVAAWRALMTRNAVTDPQADPDYVLTAARHQAGGRKIAFALAWDRDGTGPDALRGVMPLAMPHPIWGRAQARPWQPPTLPRPGAALIDGPRPEAVETAIRGRLAGLRRPLRLAPPRTDGGVRTIPADCIVGVRPADYAPPYAVEHVSDPVRIGAAVEEFLVLDARHAAEPIIADPSEASMVRVVTRLFARRGQMRVDLARRAGELVAGTLHLGAGARAVVWRHAARA